MKNGLKLGAIVAVITLFFIGNAGLASANPFSKKLITVARDKTDASIARDLIEKGADVNARDENGATPLALAAKNGHNAILKVLIANGADLNAQDFGGHTPLMWAVTKGNGKSAKILLESGAAPDMQNQHGQTALMLSANLNRNYIAKTLLKEGADVSIKDVNGHTAHSYASRRELPSGAMIRLVSDEVK